MNPPRIDWTLVHAELDRCNPAVRAAIEYLAENNMKLAFQLKSNKALLEDAMQVMAQQRAIANEALDRCAQLQGAMIASEQHLPGAEASVAEATRSAQELLDRLKKGQQQ